MGLQHINGSAVYPDEIYNRVLADNLIWIDRLLQYHRGEIADRIRNVVYDALHSGNGKKPYWKSVSSFIESHRDVLLGVLKMEMPAVLMEDFRRRFKILFKIIQDINANEPIEEFDVDFRDYLDQIACMIHEFKHIASKLRNKEVDLPQACPEAQSKIIARAWSNGALSFVKHSTTLSCVNPDGSLDGRSDPVILEVGSSKRKIISSKRKSSHGWGLPSYLVSQKQKPAKRLKQYKW